MRSNRAITTSFTSYHKLFMPLLCDHVESFLVILEDFKFLKSFKRGEFFCKTYVQWSKVKTPYIRFGHPSLKGNHYVYQYVLYPSIQGIQSSFDHGTIDRKNMTSLHCLSFGTPRITRRLFSAVGDGASSTSRTTRLKAFPPDLPRCVRNISDYSWHMLNLIFTCLEKLQT